MPDGLNIASDIEASFSCSILHKIASLFRRQLASLREDRNLQTSRQAYYCLKHLLLFLISDISTIELQFSLQRQNKSICNRQQSLNPYTFSQIDRVPDRRLCDKTHHLTWLSSIAGMKRHCFPEGVPIVHAYVHSSRRQHVIDQQISGS